MAFPNATIHVDKRESDHWLSKENLEEGAGRDEGLLPGSADGHRALRRRRQMAAYDSDAEIVPGIKPVSYGRRPATRRA